MSSFCCNNSCCRNSNCCRPPVPPVPPRPPFPPFPPGGVISFADYYDLITEGEVVTVAPGANVDFPLTGASGGNGITRTGVGTYGLSAVGSYLVLFEVGVEEAGQLVLTLNGAELPYTVTGSASIDSQIIGMAIVTTTVANSILSVQNPASDITSLTLTPVAGGTMPVSAHLTIIRLQ